MTDPVFFTLAVLAVLGTPGPTNTLLATGGALVGLRGALRLLAAEALGYSIAILAFGLVLGPIVSAAPTLAAVLRAAVGAYLLLLAVRLWRSGGVYFARRAVVTPAQVFLTTLLNPKAIVFALGIIPFGTERVWPYMLGFLLLLVCIGIGWIAVGAILGAIADGRGVGGIVPRAGAAAIGAFAMLLLVFPLLR
jgi:threonine/homoserine/homoserine lactone efflux protein